MTDCWVFFFQLYEFVQYEIYKSMYELSYIEHSWRFIRVRLYILKLNHSQIIFFIYI